MKVLITKAFNSSWYYHKVGEIVEVKLVGDNYYKYIRDEPFELLIKIKDCEVVYSNGQSSIQIKEKYMNDKEIENIAKNIYKAITNTITDHHNELSQAIALLQSNGYTLTPPYIQPTDDEICERIKSMNEEVGYVADFSVVDNKYYIYFVDNKYDYGGSQTCKILNTPYTTQSIAQQIVAELNEKRFVRVYSFKIREDYIYSFLLTHTLNYGILYMR